MSFIINPNKYKFTTSQDIVITYELTTGLDYGYLYGLDGVINSKAYNQKTLIFPPFTKEGTYSNCYIGAYIGDEWIQSDYFTIEISNATPPPIDNPPFVNNISNKNTLVNQSTTISYTATDDKGISSHEFSDNGGSTYEIINPTKNGDVYSFTKSYSSTGNRTCKIRITDTSNQRSESNSFTIYVTSSNILVESVLVNPSSGVINVGETLQLTATVNPSNATNQNIRWDSLNGDILSVNSNGLVTGISEGSGWVRAMSQDGSNKFKDVRMTINPGSSNVPVSSVNISPKTLNLNVGNSGQLNHTITPSNATNQNITYSSSNTGIATVDNNGLVNAISQGNCVTTATTQDGNKTDTCNVTVSNVPSTNTPPNLGSVLVNNENYNGTYTLTYNVVDKENDNISHELKIGNDNYKSINPIKSNSTYKYNGSGLGIGAHTGQIKVSDGKTTVTSDPFTIRINEKPASVKAELKLAKDDYDTKHKALKDTINSIILDNKFDKDTERTLLDNAFSNYNSSLAKYKEVSQKAIDSISQKKVDNVKTEIDRDIEDLNNALGDLEGTINGALSDGILSEAEKISIKQHLQIISREKIDIDKQYEVVYINEDLIGDAKNNLKISYDTYNTKYLNLVNAINEVVNKVGTLDSADQSNLNNAFNEYKNASADYSKRVNEAIDAIARKKAEDAEINAKKHTDAEIKLTKESIALKVSQEVYDNNNKVIEEEFSKINQTTKDITIEVKQKLNSDELSSRIQQSVSDIQIGFNGINDRININPRSMDFTSEQGSRDMSLYGGQLCAFNSSTNQFLSTTGSIIADGYHINGAGFLLSKHCNHFLIGRDNTWDDIFTNRAPRPTHYFDIDFDNYQIKMGLPMLTGDINMRGGSLYDANVGYIKDWYGFGWRLHEDGHQLMHAEGHRVKFNVPVSFDGHDLMNPTLYTNRFFFTNGHLAFQQSPGTENVMSNGCHWDFNGMDLVNARIVGSSMGLEVVNNPTTRTYGEKKSIFDEIEVIEPVTRSFDSIGTLDVSNVSDKGSIMLDEDNAEQGKLITLLFKKVKEQDKRIEELEKLVNQLLKTQ